MDRINGRKISPQITQMNADLLYLYHSRSVCCFFANIIFKVLG